MAAVARNLSAVRAKIADAVARSAHQQQVRRPERSLAKSRALTRYGGRITGKLRV